MVGWRFHIYLNQTVNIKSRGHVHSSLYPPGLEPIRKVTLEEGGGKQWGKGRGREELEGRRTQKGQEADPSRPGVIKNGENVRSQRRDTSHPPGCRAQEVPHLWRLISSSSTRLWISLVSVATWIFVTNSVPQSSSLASFWNQIRISKARNTCITVCSCVIQPSRN